MLRTGNIRNRIMLELIAIGGMRTYSTPLRYLGKVSDKAAIRWVENIYG